VHKALFLLVIVDQHVGMRGSYAVGNCSTYHCYKGGPAEPPQGLETNGCPLYSHPAQLTDNRNCVLCMECDKVGRNPRACPWKPPHPM
jgi:polyferredoxin